MDFLSPQSWALWFLTAAAAYLGAYAAEKGKRRAAREDRDQILEEVAKTTRRLKQIEATISNELWERQWRLNQQRDAYLTFISALSAYGNAFNAFNDAAFYKGLDSDPEPAKRLSAAADELMRAETSAELFCGEHVQRAIAAVHEIIGRAGASHIKAIANVEPERGAPQGLDVADLLTRLAQAARSDLGVPPIERRSMASMAPPASK
jgi:hypothetical protein